MRNTSKYTLALSLLVVGLSSCKKEYDTPPVNTIPEGHVITIDSLRNLFQGTPVHFNSDYSVYGVVTADEVDGNLYKNIYVQEGNAAINVRLLNSGGLYIGDRIRISLKGTVLSQYNGVLQLDSVDTQKNVVKQESGVTVEPLDVNIADINSSLQSRLVRVNAAEFEVAEIGQTYADGANQISKNRMLTDCSGNTLIVRTSGFANFANQPVATGHGSLVGIVSEFGGDMQLYIRRYSEIHMTGTRCSGNPPLLKKDFEDNSPVSGGWSIQNVSGSINWATNGVGASSGDYYGQCSNYVSGSNFACETWLISPSVNLSSAVNPVFKFINACNYSGSNIEVLVSSNYTSGNPTAATWTTLTPVLSTGSWTWVSSGDMSLSSFIGQSNVRVAFKYTGTSSNGKTWEIDDIEIAEQ